MNQILHQQLSLTGSKPDGVPKLLSDDQIAEQVRTSQALIDLVWKAGKSVLDRIITMDEFVVSMHTPVCSIHAHACPVSMHTPENQAEIKEWLEQGVPGPVKAKGPYHQHKDNGSDIFLLPGSRE